MGKVSVPRETARRLIREATRRGLVPGDRLAPEPQLVEQFGVSRASLREALRVLSFLGAVETRVGQHGGIRMAKPQPGVVVSALAMVGQSRGTTRRMVFEAARAIEPTSAAMAARHRTDDDLLALEHCVRDLGKARDAAEFEQTNLRFHYLLAQATGNELLAIMMPALVAMVAANSWSFTPTNRSRHATEKTRIVEAIASGDSMTANTLMADHLTRLLRWWERTEPEWLDELISWASVDEYIDRYGHLFTDSTPPTP